MEVHNKKYNHYFQCCGTAMRDWSGANPDGSSMKDNLYCKICGQHLYKNTIYSKHAWFNYVNKED